MNQQQGFRALSTFFNIIIIAGLGYGIYLAIKQEQELQSLPKTVQPLSADELEGVYRG